MCNGVPSRVRENGGIKLSRSLKNVVRNVTFDGERDIEWYDDDGDKSRKREWNARKHLFATRITHFVR